MAGLTAANRAAFEESFRIIKRAWTEDMLQYDGKYWKVPVQGTPWDLEATALYGAGVEGGQVRALGVVPKPLQRPHPPLFQPFASSDRSIRWCAEEGVTAILPPLHPSLESRLVELYAEVSGRPLGEGIGVLRDIVIADTDEKAMELWADSGFFCGSMWFAPFGFNKGLEDPISYFHVNLLWGKQNREATAEVKKVITDVSGEVTGVENIGRKDFARVTDKKLTGAHYVHINFSAPAEAPKQLREKLRLNSSVYRTFIQSA